MNSPHHGQPLAPARPRGDARHQARPGARVIKRGSARSAEPPAEPAAAPTSALPVVSPRLEISSDQAPSHTQPWRGSQRSTGPLGSFRRGASGRAVSGVGQDLLAVGSTARASTGSAGSVMHARTVPAPAAAPSQASETDASTTTASSSRHDLPVLPEPALQQQVREQAEEIQRLRVLLAARGSQDAAAAAAAGQPPTQSAAAAAAPSAPSSTLATRVLQAALLRAIALAREHGAPADSLAPLERAARQQVPVPRAGIAGDAAGRDATDADEHADDGARDYARDDDLDEEEGDAAAALDAIPLGHRFNGSIITRGIRTPDGDYLMLSVFPEQGRGAGAAGDFLITCFDELSGRDLQARCRRACWRASLRAAHERCACAAAGARSVTRAAARERPSAGASSLCHALRCVRHVTPRCLAAGARRRTCRQTSAALPCSSSCSPASRWCLRAASACCSCCPTT